MPLGFDEQIHRMQRMIIRDQLPKERGAALWHLAGQVEKGLRPIFETLDKEVATLKNARNAEHGRVVELEGDLEELKRKVRELEEKRYYDCAELGCDRNE
jgi:hypothetical protein